jgi:hypothetical protein
MPSICPNCSKELELGDWPWCHPNQLGQHRTHAQDAQIHAREKVLVYDDPRTGKTTIPASTDRSTHTNRKYESFGLIPREVNSMGELRRVEKKTKTISEVLNYDRGSGRAERDLGGI